MSAGERAVCVMVDPLPGDRRWVVRVAVDECGDGRVVGDLVGHVGLCAGCRSWGTVMVPLGFEGSREVPQLCGSCVAAVVTVAASGGLVGYAE